MQMLNSGLTPMSERRDMKTAPRDGTTIVVGDPDCGEFPMRWDAQATNPLVGSCVGLWVMDGELTWSEHGGFGPTYWRPVGDGAGLVLIH